MIFEKRQCRKSSNLMLPCNSAPGFHELTRTPWLWCDARQQHCLVVERRRSLPAPALAGGSSWTHKNLEREPLQGNNPRHVATERLQRLLLLTDWACGVRVAYLAGRQTPPCDRALP
jgi:hypothetical protein